MLSITLLATEATISEFGRILLFILGGIVFVLLGLLVNHLISPQNPNPEKLSTYESGEVPVGDAVIQFNTRFYLIGLIFLIFDVEVLFLYPWATVYADQSIIEAVPNWGPFVLVEMFVFAGILLLGLIYAWARGDLDWVKPIQASPEPLGAVKPDRYQSINQRYRGSRAPSSPLSNEEEK